MMQKRKRLLALTVSAALAVGMAAVATPVHAYARLGCQLPSTSTSVHVSKTVAGTKWGTATTTARSRWNGEKQPVTFTNTSSSSAKVLVNRADSNLPYLAVTKGSCLQGKWTGQVVITWNGVGTSGLSASALRMIAAHEFGHVLGLDHVTRKCSGAKAVMVQGSTKWSCGWGNDDPWADDVKGVNAIY